MAINFGMPYKGSKSKIARDLIGIIPSGERFVDVFAGGCAMSHAALLAGRWKSVLANDITDTPQFFVDALQGKYKDRNEWISREDFFRLKDSDPFVRYCYSFGNGGTTYLYSKEIEPIKKALHYAVVYQDFRLIDEINPKIKEFIKGKTITEKRVWLRGVTRNLIPGAQYLKELPYKWSPKCKGTNIVAPVNAINKTFKINITEKGRGNQQYICCDSLTFLEHLDRFERIQSLERPGETIIARKGDYRTLKVQLGDVLYCDPPYKGATGYNGQGFDSEAFYDWACSQSVPVYISEYDMPRDRFLKVWEKKVSSRISAKGGDYAFERLYVPRKK